MILGDLPSSLFYGGRYHSIIASFHVWWMEWETCLLSARENKHQLFHENDLELVLVF